MTYLPIYDTAAHVDKQHYRNVIGLSHEFTFDPGCDLALNNTNIFRLVTEQMGDTWLPANKRIMFPRMLPDLDVTVCTINVHHNESFLYAIVSDEPEVNREKQI